MLKRLCFIFCACFLPVLAVAQDKEFALAAPQELIDSGILAHILPRFSLKTGIRIALNGPGAQARLGLGGGRAVFVRGDETWRIDADDAPLPQAFAEWLTSEVGKRTIEAFRPSAGAPFLASIQVTAPQAELVVEGDAEAGERLSLRQCGRCHVINETNRMNAIGSAPSFPVLRTFDTWLDRFETFYVLKPHGAFTQIDGITAPFDPARPSPIAPVEMTQDDLQAIIAYMATVAPADLGQPIQSQ